MSLLNFLKKKPVVSNLDTKTILSNNELENIIVDTLMTIKCVLDKSYGPLGANTIINSNSIEPPKITKDGLTILENIFFSDSIKRNIHTIISATAKNLVRSVGDGSTSSVLIAVNLYLNLYINKHLFKYNKQMLDTINIISNLMISNIDSHYTYTITDENRSKVLNAIASISNNNDVKLGSKVADIFSKIPEFSNVKIELDPQEGPVDITYKVENGFSFSGRIFSAAYLKDKPSITVLKPLIFTSYEFFDQHFELIAKVYNTLKRPIIIVSEVIDSNAANLCYAHNLKGAQIYLIRSNSLMSDEVRNEFIDLAIFNDSNIVKLVEDFINDDLGSCESVDILPNRTIFNMGQGIFKGTDIYNDRLNEVKNALISTPDNKPIAKGSLKNRLNKINGVNIILFVKGRTIEEKESAKYLVEDAVLACKSAIESGFTLGSNVSSFYAIRNIMLVAETIYKNNIYNINNLVGFDEFKLLLESIYNAYHSLLEENIYNVTEPYLSTEHEYEYRFIVDKLEEAKINEPVVYNIIKNELETKDETVILAPVNTDKEIIKTSFAIVTTLLSTNQFLIT